MYLAKTSSSSSIVSPPAALAHQSSVERTAGPFCTTRMIASHHSPMASGSRRSSLRMEVQREVKKGRPPAIDTANFNEPTSPLMPPPITSWNRVLESINCGSLQDGQHPESWQVDRRFMFPKPLL
ncbi:hypothetical protein EW146_g4759 [Bondarzewia mesenterica]|uniref:Uncharacterized protein n=1 Tax=Bondarzewia mesenterica TaxID=1095465 RepID=A0A4S4LVD4_9AGAM|nr:hypothetical protein EW146_g4759 [Bondarzewia mesenterica]